jgi:hypothetical protein
MMTTSTAGIRFLRLAFSVFFGREVFGRQALVHNSPAHPMEGTMRPTTSRSEFGQFVRLLFVSALILAGIGAAISIGPFVLQLFAMR